MEIILEKPGLKKKGERVDGVDGKIAETEEDTAFPPFHKKKDNARILAERKRKVQEIFSELKNSKSIQTLMSMQYQNGVIELEITPRPLPDLSYIKREYRGYYVNSKIQITENTIRTYDYGTIYQLLLHNLIHAIIGRYHHHDIVWQHWVELAGGDKNLRCQDGYNYKKYQYLYCCSNVKCMHSTAQERIKEGVSQKKCMCGSQMVYIRSS